METFDAVIVGARCAGSPLAVSLARRGLRVCVLDRSRFPSETPSTHVIQPSGAAKLDRLGVLDAVVGAGAALIDRFTLVNDDVRIEAGFDTATFPLPALCVRRMTLDALLVEAAADAGADVRTGVKATGLLVDDGRVVGVETDHAPIRARLVVGADGRHSSVASSVGAQKYLTTPQGRTPTWGYFEGVTEGFRRLRIARLGKHAYLASPTDAGLYMVCVATGGGAGADRGATFAAGIAGWPELAELLAGARRVGPLRVMARWHGYFRQSAGPGWALVGDSGHFKDFTPGQGIADALRQAERLADMLPDDLADRRSVDAATRRWWRWRDRDARPMHWFATDMGVPGPPTPLLTQVLRDVAADPEAILDLMKVLNHEAHPRQLMTTGRLVGAAARTIRGHPDQLGATGKEIAAAVRDDIRRRYWSRKRPPGMTDVRRRRVG